MKNSDDSGYTGKHVGVCVLDTGIFPHIDFTGRILAFQDFIGHRIRPYDDNSHGTHVCGIIGGDGRASEGRIRGIAPGCSLIVLKVLDRTGNGRKEDVLQAFRWILENKRYYGIRVVNISVGTTCRRAEDHRVLIAGVEQLWDAGLVVVAAAGNQGPKAGSVTAPGSSRKIITVGSSDLLTGRTAISGRGPTFECVCKPDLVAPGNHVLACAPGAGSQFFIMHKDAPHLDGAYAAFGKITEGMDVVNRIAEEDTDYSDRPLDEQKIKSMTVETFGVDYPEPEKC